MLEDVTIHNYTTEDETIDNTMTSEEDFYNLPTRATLDQWAFETNCFY